MVNEIRDDQVSLFPERGKLIVRDNHLVLQHKQLFEKRISLFEQLAERANLTLQTPAVISIVMSDLSDDSMDEEGRAHEPTDEQMQTMMELQQALEKNGQDYDAHVRYVALLRACGLREKLREARQAFHDAFPLTETMWLEWIEDESAALETVEDVERLEALLGESHEDYMSVSLWSEHIHVSLARFEQRRAKGEEEGVAARSVRGVFDTALKDCGTHVVEGAALWNMCLDFELEGLSPGIRDDTRIEGLFVRFFACPFPPEVLQDAQARYVAWIGQDEVPRSVEKSIERSGRAYELRRGHEEALSSARAADLGGMAHLSTYASYVELEMASGAGSEARVRTVFERAIVDFPTSDFLWKWYLAWQFEGRRTESDAESRAALLRRALRNCPWSGDVWMRHLGSLSLVGASDELSRELKRCRTYLESNAMEFQKAVFAVVRSSDDSSGNEALLRACMGLLRDQKIVDPDHRCAWMLSSMLAKVQGVEAGVAIWEGLVAEGTLDAQYGGTWISYFDFLLRFCGDADTKRSVFERAMAADVADKAYVAGAWVRFEEQEGSQEHLDKARGATADVLRHVEAAQRGISLDLDAITESLTKADARNKRQQQDPNFKKKKGGAIRTGSGGDQGSKGQQRNKGQQKKKAMDKRLDTAETEAEAGPQAGKKRKAPGADQGDGMAVDASAVNKNLVTVFVKYIEASVTEEELKAEFASCGSDLDISLGRDPKTGRSKGFAYITCSKETSDKLCALDGKEHKGKRLLIAPSAPPEKKTKDKGKHRPDNRPRDRPKPNAPLPKEHQRTKIGGASSVSMLVPRGAAKKAVIGKNETATPAVAHAGSNAGQPNQPKSNDEFRRMFMK